MHKVLITLGAMLLAVTLIGPVPASAQESFGPVDLSGYWAVFFYGGYDVRTEFAYGKLHLDEWGQLTWGEGDYRGEHNAFVTGRLSMDINGGITGYLRMEVNEWKLMWGRMDLGKSQIIALAKGRWAPVLLRMVKLDGSPN